MQSLEQKKQVRTIKYDKIDFFTFSHLLQYRDKVGIVIVKKRSKFMS